MKTLLKGAALAAFVLFSSTTARSDEFALVPVGDAAYKQLALLAPTGWIESRAEPKAALTRYEIATEAARAVLALQARRDAGQTLAISAPSRVALRALRELVEKFRPELRALGIDAVAAVRMCDELISSPTAAPSVAPPAAVPGSRPLTMRPAFETRIPSLVRPSAVPQPVRTTRAELPISSRLRFETVVSKLSRDAIDPFGDTNENGLGSGTRAGVAFAVNHRIALHAFGGRTSIVNNANAALGLERGTSSLASSVAGGGVSIELPRGVQLRGNVERLNGSGTGAPDWNRVGGELGFSAWSNRLSLRANWSRLLPLDARLLPSSAGGVDVGLDVSERLRLTVLYRQLFGENAETATNRVVTGGISINF